MPIRLVLNGVPRSLRAPAHRVLVDFLRDDLGLTGTKKGCGSGDCGACTVLLDGRPVYSCLLLAAQCSGSEIRTIESLERAEPDPVVEAFVAEDAAQCGFCTPGHVLAVVALVESPDRSPQALERALSGNLCRCGAYEGIRRAARRALAATARERTKER